MRHGARLVLGSKLKQKVVVFESDDWGAIRTPSISSYTRLSKVFKDNWNSPFYSIDSLESAEDLDDLFSVLRSFRDVNGHHPKITANTIIANPDFDAIQRKNFASYSYERFTDTLTRERGAETVEVWKNGVDEKLFVPQLHGREHLHALAWIGLLQSGAKSVLAAFCEGVCNVPVNIQQAYPKRNLSAALNLSGDQDEATFHRTYLEDAVREFRAIFGIDSKTFIAPSYIWNADHEKVLNNHGVSIFQGIGYQYAPVNSHEYRRIFRYFGQTNELGQFYSVRNCFFEPALVPGVDWVSRCLNQINWAFRFGLPAVIGTHRINFIGSLSPKNRKNNLIEFRSLIREILRRWPDVEFSDSSSLSSKF